MKKPEIEPSTNPYINARREWNERYGSYIARAHSWKITAFFMMGISICSVGGIIYIGSMSKFIPFVVEVDQLGRPMASKLLENTISGDKRVFKAQLAEFIANFRNVIIDASVQNEALKKLYAMLSQNDAATLSISEYFKQAGNSPFERAKDESVSIEIKTVLPISKTTWVVEWLETTRTRQGSIKDRLPMKATMTVKIVPPTTEAQIIRNPTGLYVTDFEWTKVL